MLECPVCKEALVWQSDYDIDDICYGNYYCFDCEVDVTIRLFVPEVEADGQ